MMQIRRLRTRFLLAGGLLLSGTLASGLWSAWTFARLSAAVGDTLRGSQETLDLTALLAGALEREDDALLLAVGGEPAGARKQLDVQRHRFATDFRKLFNVLDDPEEQAAAASLRTRVDAYRAAGDSLLTDAGGPDALRRYHQFVNPALRRAVADCEQIRVINFRLMQRAAARARDQAGRATAIVIGLGAVACALTAAALVLLARAVLGPVHELTASLDAVRGGDFGRRVAPAAADELGQLAEGFNRMAEALADYKSSSLGELLQAKHTLEATLAALPDAVIVIDPDGRIVTLNPPAREILGPAADGDGRRVEQLPLAPAYGAAVRAALHGESRLPARTRFDGAVELPVQGVPRKYFLKSVPIPEFAPRRAGAVVVLDDVTEFVRLDELRSELVGVASHELKTPLTTLQMNLLLIGERADNLTDRQREMLAAAVQGCEELAGTIDELLDLTRSEAGQLRLNPGPVDVAALIVRTLDPLRPRFDDADIALHVAAGSEPVLVRGDGARLRTVFANLFANALKYTPRGGTVTVAVASGQSAGEEAGGAVQIAVTDTGPGIPEEYRERVFEKFFRVEHQRPAGGDGVRGTGIGLYLCRQIAAAHGGRIGCEPGPGGRGTRFALELPRGE